MKENSLILSFKSTLVALFVCAGAAPAQETEVSIPNFRRLSPQIATSGQPTVAQLKALKEAGFKTILNLRPPEEGSLEEKAGVEALGLTYVNIPITSQTITEDKVERFSRVVQDASNKPLLIHCASASRVGGLWYIHRVLKAGSTEDESLAEAREIGLKSPALEQIVRDYVTQHRAKPE